MRDGTFEPGRTIRKRESRKEEQHEDGGAVFCILGLFCFVLDICFFMCVTENSTNKMHENSVSHKRN